MKTTILSIIGSLIIAGSAFSADFVTQLRSPDHLSRSVVIDWNRYQLQNQQDSMSTQIPTIDKSFFKSLLIPGWGQFSQKKMIRAGVFLGLDIAAFTGYFVYNNKYNDQLDLSHQFAEDHWTAERWLFENHYNPQEDPSTHKITIRCASSDEEWDVPQLGNDGTAYIPDGVSQCQPSNLQVVWNGESYENAYKYDEFAKGWDTYDSSNPDNTITTDPNVYFINPNRLINKHQREKANDYANIATYFVYGIIGNHVLSAFETLLFPPSADKSHAGVDFDMRYIPQRVNNQLYTSMQFQLAW